MIKLIILFLFSLALYGNMNAPFQVTKYPSGALENKSKGLFVNSENLSFECTAIYPNVSEKETYCTVIAKYSISADASGNHRFEFILPSKQDVEVKIQSEKKSVNLEKIQANDLIKFGISTILLKTSEKEESEVSVYIAKFEGKIEKGNSEIVVSYRQDFSISQIGKSYVSSGTYNSDFRYFLWPLKEWSMADDFKMEISVSFIPTDSTLQKIKFDTEEIYLIGANRKYVPEKKEEWGTEKAYWTEVNLVEIPSISKEKIDSKKNTKFSLNKNFPDIIRILISRTKPNMN